MHCMQEPPKEHQNAFAKQMQNPNAKAPKHFCEEGYPYRSVGDFNITSYEHFKDAKKNIDHLLLVISGEYCIECCKWESWIDTVAKTTFQNSTHPTLGKYNFKIARLDIFEQDWYKKELKMDEMPYMAYYRKGDLFTFPTIRDPPRMARVVERYNNFYQTLNSVEEAEYFIQKDYAYDFTGRILTRPKALAIIWDHEEYQDFLTSYTQIATDFQWREDISFGLVTSKSVAQDLKKKYPNWFGQNIDSNTILMHRHKGRHLDEFNQAYNLLEELPDYNSVHDFIGMNSLDTIEEYTHINRNAFHGQVPKVFMFYNPIDLNKSNYAIDEFKKIAKKNGRKYNYLIADGRDNKRKMVSLGQNKCELPCIGFESPQAQNTVFKYDNSLLGYSLKNVTLFLEKYSNGEMFDSKKEVDLMWDNINQHEKIAENMT